MSRWRHGSGLIVCERDHAEEAAAFRMARHDPIPSAYESGKLLGIGKCGHLLEALVAVAMDTIGFEHGPNAGKRTCRSSVGNSRASHDCGNCGHDGESGGDGSNPGKSGCVHGFSRMAFRWAKAIRMRRRGAIGGNCGLNDRTKGGLIWAIEGKPQLIIPSRLRL